MSIINKSVPFHVLLPPPPCCGVKYSSKNWFIKGREQKYKCIYIDVYFTCLHTKNTEYIFFRRAGLYIAAAPRSRYITRDCSLQTRALGNVKISYTRAFILKLCAYCITCHSSPLLTHVSQTPRVLTVYEFVYYTFRELKITVRVSFQISRRSYCLIFIFKFFVQRRRHMVGFVLFILLSVAAGPAPCVCV